MTSLLLRIDRVRTPLFHGALLVALAAIALNIGLPGETPGKTVLAFVPALAVLVFVLLLGVQRWALKRQAVPEERVVTAPVTGRWLAMNSPASAVPSHGVRTYGQTYAIDLCHEPDGPGAAVRPTFGDGSGMRPVGDYPAFGQPVRSMVDGEVVTVVDSQRDHRARSSWWAIAYLTVEGMVRELGGPRFIVGNHVTVRTDDGVYALLAHLQQGSATVRVGDRLAAGQVLGACGNSGNSSEPHVHAQLMDRRSPWTGQGLPMAYEGVRIGDADTPVTGLPENQVHLVAG